MPPSEGLDASKDVYYQINDISRRRQAIDKTVISLIDGLAESVWHHWLLLFNVVNGLIFAGTFIVPLLNKLGQTGMAGTLFRYYRILCVQNPSHSYFIFGYQMAMDQRMTAIFGAIFVSGIVFSLVGKDVRPLSWRLYVLFLVPIAVDGFTQLFGWRESNWQLRTITGVLFGVANVWLAVPQLQTYMALLQSGDRVAR